MYEVVAYISAFKIKIWIKKWELKTTIPENNISNGNCY